MDSRNLFQGAVGDFTGCSLWGPAASELTFAKNLSPVKIERKEHLWPPHPYCRDGEKIYPRQK